MKRIAELVLKTVARELNYLAHESISRERKPALTTRVRELAIDESAAYIFSNLHAALLFDDREDLWGHALESASLEGLHLEFGVWKGNSINSIARAVSPVDVFGFDSFEGLREDWPGTHRRTGHFDTNGTLPEVESNVQLVKGWFQVTLPEFLTSHQGNVAFLHLDADTYESTLYVLEQLKSQIVAGTVIVFDEYLGIPNWKNNEFKAWKEFRQSQKLDYCYIGFGPEQAALKVL